MQNLRSASRAKSSAVPPLFLTLSLLPLKATAVSLTRIRRESLLYVGPDRRFRFETLRIPDMIQDSGSEATFRACPLKPSSSHGWFSLTEAYDILLFFPACLHIVNILKQRAPSCKGFRENL